MTSKFKTDLSGLVGFDADKRVVKDQGMTEAVETCLLERHTAEELDTAEKVVGTFQEIATEVFRSTSSVLRDTLIQEDEVGALDIGYDTRFGRIEVGMNKPEGGLNKDNVAAATEFSLTNRLDSEMVQSAYDDLEDAFNN